MTTFWSDRKTMLLCLSISPISNLSSKIFQSLSVPRAKKSGQINTTLQIAITFRYKNKCNLKYSFIAYQFLVGGRQSQQTLKEGNQFGSEKMRTTERLLSRTQHTDVLDLEEILSNLIWISAGINPLSLLAICKTHSLQFYKYPFKSKGGIVANIQTDVPSLKNLREKTLFLFSSSLQE